MVSLSSERDQACEEKEVTAARSNQLKEDNKKLMHRLAPATVELCSSELSFVL